MSVRTAFSHGRLSATPARAGEVRPRQTAFLLNVLIAVSVPALFLAGALGPAHGQTFEVIAPPEQPALASGNAQVTELREIGPLDGHNLAVGPSAVFSRSGLTLYEFSAYPESPNDNRPDGSSAPGFTPLTLGLVRQDPFRLGGDPVEGQSRTASESAFSRDRVGIGFSQGFGGGWRLSVTGNYGILRLPVDRGVDVAEEQDLLRLGANLEYGELSLRGSMGADIKPFKVGKTLAWDLAAAYREGPWSLNLAYTHSILAEGPTEQEVETLGTLQGGIGYDVTSNVTASASALFWNFSEEEGGSATDIGGLLTLSMRF